MTLMDETERPGSARQFPPLMARAGGGMTSDVQVGN